jgi:hypothetical protein
VAPTIVEVRRVGRSDLAPRWRIQNREDLFKRLSVDDLASGSSLFSFAQENAHIQSVVFRNQSSGQETLALKDVNHPPW